MSTPNPDVPELEVGQVWALEDEGGRETDVLVLEDGTFNVLVLVLDTTLEGCEVGSVERFSVSWFRDSGSLLSSTW